MPWEELGRGAGVGGNTSLEPLLWGAPSLLLRGYRLWSPRLKKEAPDGSQQYCFLVTRIGNDVRVAVQMADPKAPSSPAPLVLAFFFFFFWGVFERIRSRLELCPEVCPLRCSLELSAVTAQCCRIAWEAKFPPEVAADFAALGLRCTEYQEARRPPEEAQSRTP